VFRTTAAELAIHPIHVSCKPVASHENHAILDLLQHGIELRASGTHAFDNLSSILRHYGSESKVISTDVESLRESKGLPTVDRVASARSEIAGMRLDLWLTPLVALPIWMAAIVIGASMIRDLLHIHISLIHIEFRTASQSIKALRIAIVVMMLLRGLLCLG